MFFHLLSAASGRLVGSLALGGFLLGTAAAIDSAQTVNPPPIKVESREVVVPIEVFQETKDPKGAVRGPNGELKPVWILRFKEIPNLTTKFIHIFEDGAEQKVQHFSFEEFHAWVVGDNNGRHAEYSCTPKGVWGGPDITQTNVWVDDSRRFHTYLLTYIPPASPGGSCHRITLKVDRRHATTFAPDQYCNTDDPLSDPLKDTELGNKLLNYANSTESGNLPLSVQVSPFFGSLELSHIDVSTEITSHFLKRDWKGIQLHTSIAILSLVFNKDTTLAARFSDIACLPSESSMGYQGPFPPINTIMDEWADLVIPVAYRSQLNLSPGDYRLVFALTDGEKFGRAEASVTVVDFRKSTLAISGIALCKRYHTPSPNERGPTRAPQYVPLMFDGTEFTPTGDTRFPKGKPIISFFEIYGSHLNDAATVGSLHLQVKVRDTKTGEVKLDSGSQPLKLNTGPENRAIPVVREISIDTLPAGPYSLEAQVSDSQGHKTDWRVVPFVVE